MAVNPAERELKNIVIYKCVKSKLIKNLANYFFKNVTVVYHEGGDLCARKSMFGVLWETVSEPSGESALLFACVRCLPYSVLQFAI